MTPYLESMKYETWFFFLNLPLPTSPHQFWDLKTISLLDGGETRERFYQYSFPISLALWAKMQEIKWPS